MSLDVISIASRENPRFKALQKQIAQPRLLRRDGLAVAEGIHLLQELSQWPSIRIREIWWASDLRNHREWPLVEQVATQLDVPCVELPGDLYQRLSELEAGAGPLMVFETPLDDLSQNQSNQDAPLTHDIVVLDGVQDPGNVGTIIRTAAAVGVTEIWSTPDCAWVWSGKVLRAAMGGHRTVRLPGLPADAQQRMAGWFERGVPIRMTCLEKADSLHAADLSPPGIWLLGSEGRGVSASWAQWANAPLRIPMQPGVESLNVASAATVCLYEQWRQRGFPPANRGVA